MPTVMQWVQLLLSKIEAQAAYAAPFEARYRNEYVLPFIVAEYRAVYGERADQLVTINPPRTGIAGITVDALTDRLTVIGATSESAEAAKVVEDAWRGSDLDVMHREAHRESLIKARSFAQVDVTDDGRSVVGIESAEQMAVHREQFAPYDVVAALKLAADEWTGERRARLWLRSDSGVRKIDLREGKVARQDPEGSRVVSRWAVLPNEKRWLLPWVPVVEFQSKPRLLAEPMSEIEPIASLVDISDLVEGLMVFAGHFGAVPIRWGTGLEPVRDPKDPTKLLMGADGKPMLGFNARADHFWGSTSADARFGQMQPAELGSFVAWAEHVASRIRAKTQVASTYYSMDLKSHMSAELLKTDEAPMVRRLRSMGREGSYNQAWRRVDQMLLAIESPDLAGVTVSPRWADEQTRIESQDADRFSKLVGSLGPEHLAREVLGWSPEMAAAAVREADEARARLQASDPMASLLSKPLTSAATSDN